ncbi:hypothetical protein QNI19_38270 [Cytophagaceae bacterium DM2B3-1]|uniref:Uncharacterized protein n=1 Tax=Xanthocytophaga flava TaxID=3048013 RepID=A0AAE3UD97_9BACT|nr:hypothetical protein [Xanthocytophaga flavus]MDJ1468570.1 hypothetical protein [Xanthocytophaga flavus]MDJ1486378.1 hypothetical protein [Xanthocytophaga flavus]MDJ1498839.1 hypothetical protein [Xanthocytophaga flavus]
MKKDIPFLPVKDVKVAVVRKTNDIGSFDWFVYLLNTNPFAIKNVFVTSEGYGYMNDEMRRTSTLRHFLGDVDSGDAAIIEPIDPAIFGLNSEYWVSYFIDNQIYDKRFIFVPDSIVEENLSYISQLDLSGVLHE